MGFGSAGYAEKLGDAHEGPSQDEEGIFDAISDKLNNLITIELTRSQPTKDCVELFKENWGTGPGIFSLNGENLTLWNTQVRAPRLASFLTSIEYLTQKEIALPSFLPPEKAIIDSLPAGANPICANTPEGMCPLYDGLA